MNQHGNSETYLNFLSKKTTQTPTARDRMNASGFLPRLHIPPIASKSSKSNKSQSFTQVLMEPTRQCKDNDLVKKVLFDNKQLRRKLEELQWKNNWLQDQNSRVEEMYVELKDAFAILSQKYSALTLGVEEEQSQKSADVVLHLVPNIIDSGLAIVQKAQTPTSLKKSHLVNLRTKHSFGSCQMSPRHAPTPKPKNGMACSMIRPKQDTTQSKEQSLLNKTVTAQTQTETDSVISSSQQRTSPSSHSSELLLQVSNLKTAMEGLQASYKQLQSKYERIRSIISNDSK